MKRDTVSAYRARAKKTNDEIAATIAEVQATEAREYKAARAAGKQAEAARVRLTRADLIGSRAIRTTTGWHRVVRVNGKSVTVATAYSWTDRVAFEQVLEAIA